MIVGILALQGDYQKHRDVLNSLEVHSILVHNSDDLNKCHALIIPGGESTTISKQIDNNGLRCELKEFSKHKPMFGTCAAMIILSNAEPQINMKPLNIIDFKISRNAWGRQVDSFSAEINLSFDPDSVFNGMFIRAPKVNYMSDKLKALAFYKDEPVLLTDGLHLVSSFHPELGNDFRIHKFFMDKINETISVTI